MSVQDLTNTTWIFDFNQMLSNGDFAPGSLYDITFTSTHYNDTYDGFGGTDIEVIYYYKNNIVQESVYDIGIYDSIGSDTITITGGAHVTNAALIAWLETSATQQIPSSTITVDLTSLSGWGGVGSGTHTLTVKAKAQGYRDSNPSVGVSFTISSAPQVTLVCSGDPNTLVWLWDGVSYTSGLPAKYAGGPVLMHNNAPYQLTEAPYDYEILSGDTVTLSPPDGAIVIQNSFNSGGGTLVSVNSGNAEIVNDFVYTVNPAFRYNDTVVGVRNISNVTLECAMSCLIEGTQITLADGSKKAVEDITYDDSLLVWNFYEGKFDVAKPEWIMQPKEATRYNLVKFDNGAELGLVGSNGYHRIFNKEAGAFTHTGCDETPNGTTTSTQENIFVKVVSQEIVEKPVKYYNIITKDHFNLFANGILTSCRLSNKYKIEDMKYAGDPLYSEAEGAAYWERIRPIQK